MILTLRTGKTRSEQTHMMDVKNSAHCAGHAEGPATETPKGSTRRKLLGQIGASFAAGMLARDASASGQSSSHASGGAAAGNDDAPEGVGNSRVLQSFALRVSAARNEARIPVPPHTTN